MSGMTLLPDHWTTLADGIRCGAVRRLEFSGVDFSVLGDDVFVVAVGFRGLQSLLVQLSVASCGSVTDALIRTCTAKGMRELCMFNNIAYSPHALSEDAIMDFFFREDAAPGLQTLRLVLPGSGVTDKFLTKFLEVKVCLFLYACTVRSRFLF